MLGEPFSFWIIIRNIVLLFSLGYLLYWKTKDTPLKKHFLPALGLKVIAGILVGALYAYHYDFQGDTFSLFLDAQKITLKLSDNFSKGTQFVFGLEELAVEGLLNGNSRAILMSKFISVVYLIAPNYWLVSVYFSLFAFAGIWALATTLVKLFPKKHWAILLSFCYWPSFVFWSSGVLKEAALIGMLFYLIAWLLQGLYLRENTKHKLIKSILSLWFIYLILKLKYYYLAVFIPCATILIFSSLIDHYFKIKLWKKYLLLLGVGLSLAFFASKLHPNLRVDYVLEAIIQNNEKMALETENKSALIHFSSLTVHPISFIKNLPTVIFEGLFRPFIWEKGHIFWKLTALENSILICLLGYFLYALFMGKQKVSSKWINLICVASIYIISLLVFLTFATPNLGTLMRYKAGFQPFLMFILLSVITFGKKI